MFRKTVQIVQDRYPGRGSISHRQYWMRIWGFACCLAHRLWNRVRCPDLIARASLVSISSANMFAMSTTTSSIAHSSYLTGSTLGGGTSGLARFGKAPTTCPAVEASPPDAPGPSEFRRLLGERGWGALSIGGSVSRGAVVLVAVACESIAVVASEVGTVRFEFDSASRVGAGWLCPSGGQAPATTWELLNGEGSVGALRGAK